MLLRIVDCVTIGSACDGRTYRRTDRNALWFLHSYDMPMRDNQARRQRGAPGYRVPPNGFCAPPPQFLQIMKNGIRSDVCGMGQEGGEMK